MQVIGIIFGILSACFMIVGFFPCLGGLNWLIIPFAGIGVIVNGIALASAGRDNRTAMAGLILCVIAMFFGLVRLFAGGGFF